jgi:hypothetical protein
MATAPMVRCRRAPRQQRPTYVITTVVLPRCSADG